LTEHIPDSPSVSRLYCPACEPDADPSCEILDVRWCTAHAPSSAGADDCVITVESFLSGSVEAGGEVNRQWCDLFHRSPERAAPASRGPTRRRARSVDDP